MVKKNNLWKTIYKEKWKMKRKKKFSGPNWACTTSATNSAHLRIINLVYIYRLWVNSDNWQVITELRQKPIMFTRQNRLVKISTVALFSWWWRAWERIKRENLEIYLEQVCGIMEWSFCFDYVLVFKFAYVEHTLSHYTTFNS